MQITDEKMLYKQFEQWLKNPLKAESAVQVSTANIEDGGGFSAEMFMICAQYETAAGQQKRELVVRKQSTHELFIDADLRLQGKILEALGQHSDLPAPEIIGVEMDASILGEPFLVMSLVRGRVVQQNPNYNLAGWLTELTAEQRGSLWKNVIESLASLHRLDWQQGFQFLDKPHRGKTGFDQFFSWFEDWHHWTSQQREQTVADAAMEYLIAHRPATTRTNVLWGDPHQSNVIFNDDLSVAALIDWELVAIGPGEIDLAFWLYFDEMWSDMYKVPRLEGLPSRQQVIEIYETALGQPVRDMEFYGVLASLRMVNIVRRSIDRQIALGKVKADSRAGTDSPWTQHLARLINAAVPEIHPDFHDYMKAVM